MAQRLDHLPPLGLLRVFEAAARCGNFTHAGLELGLSQAAVSQQIRSLERHLDVRLFERKHRRVELTLAGSRLFNAVRVSLEMIAATSRDIRKGQAPSNLRIAADIPFAQHWLMPRLADFSTQHPHINPSVMASDYDADCLRDEVDIAILYGSGDWPGFVCEFLLDEEIFPICSPDYLQRHGPITLECLGEHVLLELHGRWDWVGWRQWLSQRGVSLGEQAVVREFNLWPLLTDAVVNGEGVGLGWKYLSDHLMDSASIVRPLHESLSTDRGYYLVRREPLSEFAHSFYVWLKQRASSAVARAFH